MILTNNTIGKFFRIVGNLESVSTLLVGGKVTNIVDKEGLTTATKKILTRKYRGKNHDNIYIIVAKYKRMFAN